MANKPATKGKRFLKLAGMTAKVGAKYASSKIKSTFQGEEGSASTLQKMYENNGVLVANTLGELKGAAMKVGQMASLASDVLPPEVTAQLQSLQKDSKPMDFDEIAAQIEREFGMSIERLYESFDEEPFAAASIGQVHRAVTDDGREVVVKVQYPGVDESCDSDLKHMERVFALTGAMRINKKAYKAMFKELRRMIKEELDYTLEADNVRTFQRLHADDGFVHVPDVVGERSAKRVLTLTYLPGDSLDHVAEHYPQETKNLVSENLYHMFGRQLFRDKMVHGDPHPGNFAFREDGTIVLYDYGCVKEIPERYVTAYRDVVFDTLERRFDRMDGFMHDLGVRTPKSDPLDEAFFEVWYDALVSPMMENEIYDYSTADQHERVKEILPFALKHALHFQPSADVAVVDRLVFGLHQMFRTIGPQFPWRDLMETQANFAKDL